MATDLRPGKELPLLKYSAEMIIAFKSTRFDLHLSPPNTTTRSSATHLVLYNVKNDIILRITIRNGQNKVFFNDRADKSLLDGWGQEQSADLSPVDVQRWKRSGVTISVHYPCPRTRFKYQILFDLTTVFYFAKRFPEPVTKIGYSVTTQSHLSDPLKVFCYEIDDLPLVERQAIKSGKVPLPIPAPDSAVIPIPPSDLFPNQPQACISLDNGKEIRIYRLGPGNILHEYIYSSKDGNSWHCAAFHNLKIVLEPTSSITAVLIQEYAIGIYYIGIYYQDPNSDFIQILRSKQDALKKDWEQGRTITKALKGTKIAVVRCPDANGTPQSRIYYQDPHLHLREYYFDHSMDNWVRGDFSPGKQPHGTHITAEVVHGGNVDIIVSWRDEKGHLVSSSHSKTRGWELPKRASRRELLDGRN